MKKLFGICAALILINCAWLQKNEQPLANIGAAVICELEKIELDNEFINQECDKILGNLTTEQAAQVNAKVQEIQAEQKAKALRGLKPSIKDAGDQ